MNPVLHSFYPLLLDGLFSFLTEYSFLIYGSPFMYYSDLTKLSPLTL
ncbi:MAG: hypothetical protein ACK52J_03300 [bacterium]